MQDKNLLVVTWTAFPPTSGSGVILSNLMEVFDPNKIVLAGAYTPGSKIEDYTKPKYPFYLLGNPELAKKKGSKFSKWLGYKKVLSQLLEIIEKHNIDVVLGVFPDEFYTYLGCKAAKTKGIPFYSWFHNTYLDNRTGFLKLLAKRIQPEIFNSSKKIFTMSIGMNEYMTSSYPSYAKKFEALLHGFSIPEITKEIDVSLNEKSLKFLLTGNINHSNKDATERICKSVLSHDKTSELHIFGRNSEKEWLDMGIRGERVFIHGFVPLNVLISRFPEFDIMLLPHGFEGNFSRAEYLTIFPTRTIPLLYSGKPILAHCPENTAISKMLKKHSCALQVNEKSTDKINIAITELISSESLRHQLVQNAFTASKLYDVNTIGQKLKQELFK